MRAWARSPRGTPQEVQVVLRALLSLVRSAKAMSHGSAQPDGLSLELAAGAELHGFLEVRLMVQGVRQPK